MGTGCAGVCGGCEGSGCAGSGWKGCMGGKLDDGKVPAGCSNGCAAGCRLLSGLVNTECCLWLRTPLSSMDRLHSYACLLALVLADSDGYSSAGKAGGGVGLTAKPVVSAKLRTRSCQLNTWHATSADLVELHMSLKTLPTLGASAA